MRTKSWVSTGVALVVMWGLTGVAVPSAAAAQNSEQEFKRTVYDLEEQSEEFKDELERFLKDEDEWEPRGRYGDLWDETEQFVKQSGKLKRRFKDEEPVRKLEQMISRMEDTAGEIDRLLDRVDASRRVEREWDDTLDLLEDADRQLDTGFGYTSGESNGKTTASGNLSTDQIDLAVNLIEDRSERVKNAFAKSGGGGTWAAQLSNQLSLFDQRANKLRDTYFKGRNPSQFLPTLGAMRGQAGQISDLINKHFTGGPVRENWSQVRNQLDVLARHFGI